jgi:hypothetical protein
MRSGITDTESQVNAQSTARMQPTPKALYAAAPESHPTCKTLPAMEHNRQQVPSKRGMSESRSFFEATPGRNPQRAVLAKRSQAPLQAVSSQTRDVGRFQEGNPQKARAQDLEHLG